MMPALFFYGKECPTPLLGAVFKMSTFLSFLIILHYEIPAFFGFEVK